MPSPSTPRRSSRRQSTRSTPPPAKSKTPDVSKPLGDYDTNSVRDRIRQWQEQVEGVVAPSDVAVQEQGENTPSPNSRPVGESTGGESLSARRAAKGKGASGNAGVTRERSHSTPRKRVLSDEHWRKNRSSTKTPETGSGVWTQAAGEDDSPQTPSREVKSNQRRRKQESERRTSNRLSAEETHQHETSPPSRTHSDRLDLTPDGDYDRRKTRLSDDDDTDGAMRLSPSPPPQDPPSKGSKESTPERRRSKTSTRKGDGRHRRRSQQQTDAIEKSPEPTLGSPSAARDDRKVKNTTRQLFESETQEVNHDILPAPAQRIPSIEAWLQETPDPFVDEPAPSVPAPAPSKTHSAGKRVTIHDPKQEDPNNIRESIGSSGSQRRRSSGDGSRRRHRVRTSATVPEEVTPVDLAPNIKAVQKAVRSPPVEDMGREDREESPSSLRRSGAHRRQGSCSPRATRESSSRETLHEAVETREAVSCPGSPPEEAFQAANPLALNTRRACPPTAGHRLSTIASVDTLRAASASQDAAATELSPTAAHSPSVVYSSHDAAVPQPGSLKRRLTTHADLISVLSLPQTGSRSIRSARSIRTTRSRLATATIDDLMQELATDETKYMRELRTLVDGVIPALLSCVLSKKDSSVAAGLFGASRSASDDLSFTGPIVDMGNALEHLRTLHKRIPRHDPSNLLKWAQGAQKVYAKYLKAWRLGFQDVVVNLVPAEADRPNSSSSDQQGLEDDMDRDADGDVINGDGEKVDVAFLLKRPLVRLKYLSKTFKGINIVKPSKAAADVSSQYQGLVDDARRRSNEERARLEDEAAASLDPTRARDPRTLGVLTDVTIDRTRTVRARDYFNLTLHHSSGQRVDCRSELLLRDNGPDDGGGGDLLVCEVDESGKWLLFPPIETGRISARNGDLKAEIVVMIRGLHGGLEEWHELLSFKADDEESGFEWVQMLGLTPVPPKIVRSQSFLDKQREVAELPTVNSSPPSTGTPSTFGKSRTPSPGEIDVPIGEKASTISRARRRPPTPKRHQPDVRAKPTSSPSNENSPRTLRQHISSWMGKKAEEPTRLAPRPRSRVESPEPLPPDQSSKDLQQTTPEGSPGLKRSKAKRISRHIDDPPTPVSTKSALSDPELTPTSAERNMNRGEDFSQDLTGPQERQQSKTPEPMTQSRGQEEVDQRRYSEPRPERPGTHRSRSSVPSMELPTIPKQRQSSLASPSPAPPLKDEPTVNLPIREGTLQPSSKPHIKIPERELKGCSFAEERPIPPPHKSPSPIPPPHRLPSPVQLKVGHTPNLGSPTSATRGKRRPSSPLKHQYEPSTASESSDSEASATERNGVSSESDLSDDEELESGDVHTPLPPMGVLRQFPKRTPPASLPTLPSATLAPSNSASQAPYKTVPPQPSKSLKAIASIFTWSDKGFWEALHHEECSIVITPGLIEAYEMNAMHSKRPASVADESSDLSSVTHEADQPLVALELTPLVPLRRGTALDISIRSPPTDRSKIRSSNNTMFRSRNPDECEALYALINHSRINNPTYIALQNARGPFAAHPSPLSRHQTVRHSRSSSWFGLGAAKKGYRASSAPSPSIAGVSESSVGTMASAFSALKRFRSNSRMFNIPRSTVTSRVGSRAGSLYSSSSGSGSGSGPSSPPTSNVGVPNDGAIGLTNAKIRLYSRETASKWRDMGAARLTITKPPPGMMPLRPPIGPSSSSSPSRPTGQEKRIVINGKTQNEVLLDACLGESCFERVARTGIAVSVWEEIVGPNGEVGVVGAVGGVGGTRARIYMLQMKSEAETAYTFSLVGKLRY